MLKDVNEVVYSMLDNRFDIATQAKHSLGFVECGGDMVEVQVVLERSEDKWLSTPNKRINFYIVKDEEQ